MAVRNPGNKHLIYFFCAAIILSMVLTAGGCTSSPPDTSAPQREVIERTADWQGSLLYIADQDGPEPDWGSIRIYDNVSGFVEESIEQTFSAGPSDVYVTPDGSSMYVSSILNGRIDKFRWDGKNWYRSGDVIDSPTSSLLTLVAGPEGRLYAADGAPETTPGGFFVVDPLDDTLAAEELTFPELASVSGICWNNDGTRAFVSGAGLQGTPVLLSITWPSGEPAGSVQLPIAAAHEVVSSPDGRQVFVMGSTGIVLIDAASMTVIGTWNPAGLPDVDYYDADFSADGRFMFTAGTAPGSDSTLYVIDLSDGATVHTVNHISRRANGILRVE